MVEYDPDEITDPSYLYYLWAEEQHQLNKEERENDVQNYWRKDPRFPGPRQMRPTYKPHFNRVLFPKDYDHFMKMVNTDTAIVLVT